MKVLGYWVLGSEFWVLSFLRCGLPIDSAIKVYCPTTFTNCPAIIEFKDTCLPCKICLNLVNMFPFDLDFRQNRIRHWLPEVAEILYREIITATDNTD